MVTASLCLGPFQLSGSLINLLLDLQQIDKFLASGTSAIPFAVKINGTVLHDPLLSPYHDLHLLYVFVANDFEFETAFSDLLSIVPQFVLAGELSLLLNVAMRVNGCGLDVEYFVQGYITLPKKLRELFGFAIIFRYFPKDELEVALM